MIIYIAYYHITNPCIVSETNEEGPQSLDGMYTLHSYVYECAQWYCGTFSPYTGISYILLSFCYCLPSLSSHIKGISISSPPDELEIPVLTSSKYMSVYLHC